MKKIVITGASGYLAKALLPIAASQANVIGVARNIKSIAHPVEAVSVDIENRAAVFDVISEHKPDAIIHCAAVNPGGSDESMIAVNEHGTRNIAEASNEIGCRLVSVSSDTVFSGNDAPYADDANSSALPENTYAVSKARGETLIQSIAPSAIIVRTSLIYGTEHIDRGTEGFAKRLEAGESLKLFTDVIRQPVDSNALSTSLCALALEHVNESGVMNIVGDEAMSRYEFGIRMLDYWGIDYEGRVEAISGIGIKGLPMDLQVTMDRAHSLGMATPGVTDVLAAQKKS